MAENSDDMLSGPMLDRAYKAWSEAHEAESGRLFDLGLAGAFFKTLFGSLYLVSFLLLIGVAVLLGFKAVRANEGSFNQHLAVEISAGIAVFLLSPFVIAAAAKWKWRAELATTVFAVALGLAGYETDHEVVRLYLIEASVALGLLVGLEIMFRRSQKLIDRTYSKIMQKIWDERESKKADVPPPYAGSGYAADQIDPRYHPNKEAAEDCE